MSHPADTRRGRPPGRRTMYGKARRVDPRIDRTYQLEVARRIRDARLERDIAPDELGLAAGIGERSIYRIENGEHRPLVRTICRIAAAMGMMPSELMP